MYLKILALQSLVKRRINENINALINPKMLTNVDKLQVLAPAAKSSQAAIVVANRLKPTFNLQVGRFLSDPKVSIKDKQAFMQKLSAWLRKNNLSILDITLQIESNHEIDRKEEPDTPKQRGLFQRSQFSKAGRFFRTKQPENIPDAVYKLVKSGPKNIEIFEGHMFNHTDKTIQLASIWAIGELCTHTNADEHQINSASNSLIIVAQAAITGYADEKWTIKTGKECLIALAKIAANSQISKGQWDAQEALESFATDSTPAIRKFTIDLLAATGLWKQDRVAREELDLLNTAQGGTIPNVDGHKSKTKYGSESSLIYSLAKELRLPLSLADQAGEKVQPRRVNGSIHHNVKASLNGNHKVLEYNDNMKGHERAYLNMEIKEMMDIIGIPTIKAYSSKINVLDLHGFLSFISRDFLQKSKANQSQRFFNRYSIQYYGDYKLLTFDEKKRKFTIGPDLLKMFGHQFQHYYQNNLILPKHINAMRQIIQQLHEKPQCRFSKHFGVDQVLTYPLNQDLEDAINSELLRISHGQLVLNDLTSNYDLGKEMPFISQVLDQVGSEQAHKLRLLPDLSLRNCSNPALDVFNKNISGKNEGFFGHDYQWHSLLFLQSKYDDKVIVLKLGFFSGFDRHLSKFWELPKLPMLEIYDAFELDFICDQTEGA